MKLLNSKSVLKCSDDEETIHNEENIGIINKLTSYPNYQCASIIKYFDKANKSREPIILPCFLHECQEMIQYVDCKNGVDIAIVEGFLTFVVYGQTYQINNQSHIVQTAIQIRPYDENRNFLFIFDESL